MQSVSHDMSLPIYGPVPQGVYQVSSPMLKKSALAPIERTSTWCSSTSCDKIMALTVDFGRSKLLCVMAGQMKRFKAHFQLPWASTAPNGVPMPVGVGVLRGAAEWKVGIMWRGDDHFSWKWIIEGALTRPGDFMHYTTFMFRLFCYGQLFKEAMQQLIEVSPNH